MDEIKELTFHLESALRELQQQLDSSLQDKKILLEEKIDFLKEIILKLQS